MKKIEIRPRGEGVRMVVTSLFSYFKNEPDIMTVPEAAKALRCGKNTIYDLIKEGKFQEFSNSYIFDLTLEKIETEEEYTQESKAEHPAQLP